MMTQLKILFIEDNPRDMELILLHLHDSGFEVADYRRVDCEQDLRLVVENFFPDVVLADYFLPLFEPFEALAIIMKLNQDLPYIVVSGYIDDEEATRLVRAGADDYIFKENFGRLGEAIRNAVEKKQTRARERQALIDLKASLARETLLRVDAELGQRSRDEFIAMLSHELRNPLSVIVGWSQLLSEGHLLPEQVMKAYKIIQASAKQQTLLVDDIMDLSKIVCGKFVIVSTAISLLDLLEQVLDSFRLDALEKHQELSFECLVSEAVIYGDERRVSQIFSNLLSNAIKFTPAHGKIQLELKELNGLFELTIRDNGEGMAPEFISTSFDKFRQENQTITRIHGGLGLGLTLAKYMTEAHGGSIHLASPGKGLGSTFTVSLPKLATAPPLDAMPSAAVPIANSLQGMTIVVVDDDPFSTVLTSTVLQFHGAKISCAHSAAEARLLLKTMTPELLICDISMPVESGIELIQSLRLEEKIHHLKMLPAIAISGLSEKDHLLPALEAGFQHYFIKPVDIKQLVVAVAQIISRPASRQD